MTELLEDLRRFLDAGDESRHYQLTRDEVRLILNELEKYQPVPVLTFNDIRAEIKHGKFSKSSA